MKDIKKTISFFKATLQLDRMPETLANSEKRAIRLIENIAEDEKVPKKVALFLLNRDLVET